MIHMRHMMGSSTAQKIDPTAITTPYFNSVEIDFVRQASE
jgi:hypothetical protein